MADLPRTMRAVVLAGHGGLDKLEYHEDWPVPKPGPGEVLVHVGACGLNNTDINTRTAWYSKGVTDGTTTSGGKDGFGDARDGDGGWGGAEVQFPRIQGADVCGKVVGLGEGAPSVLLGRRALIEPWLRDPDEPLNLERCRFLGSEVDGGYAEYAVVDADAVYPIESRRSDAELATFATSYITAENMLNRATVGAGDRVLIPGASGGVGSALIQLVRRRSAGAIAMCAPDKSHTVRETGAVAVLPRGPRDLAGALLDATGDAEVDVVADVVGGEIWPQLLKVLARGGRYTCAGAIAGPIVSFDLRTFYLRDLTLTGATVVPPGVFSDLVGYIEREEIKPLLAQTYPLRELARAQEAFMEKRHVGNIVVTM